MSGINPVQFAKALLPKLGAPVNHQTISALVGWATAEGGSVHNNPFNTTEDAPGATIFNSVGVKSYTNFNEALNATAKTLLDSSPQYGYGNIVGALRRSDPQGVGQAISSSSWGTGSLAESSIATALGHNWGVKPSGAPKQVAQQHAMSQPNTNKTTSKTITEPGVTTKTTTGGGVDYVAALRAALLTPTAINVNGTLPAPSLLSKFQANVGSGAYMTPVVNNVSTSAGQSATITNKTIAQAKAHGAGGQVAITNKAVADAAAAGAPQDVQHLLKMIHNVNGSAYSTANHDDINERDVNIKAAGTDCSGFVSWLMGPHGLGIWSTSLATPSIDDAPGILKGAGKQITIWNNDNPGASGHVFIQIGTGKHAQYWASEGGVGIHQLPLSEVQNYIQNGSDGGHYVALHPKGL